MRASNIVGEEKKPRRFSPGLAAKVNAETKKIRRKELLRGRIGSSQAILEKIGEIEVISIGTGSILLNQFYVLSRDLLKRDSSILEEIDSSELFEIEQENPQNKIKRFCEEGSKYALFQSTYKKVTDRDKVEIWRHRIPGMKCERNSQDELIESPNGEPLVALAYFKYCGEQEYNAYAKPSKTDTRILYDADSLTDTRKEIMETFWKRYSKLGMPSRSTNPWKHMTSFDTADDCTIDPPIGLQLFAAQLESELNYSIEEFIKNLKK